MATPSANKSSGQFINIQKLHVAKLLTDTAGGTTTYDTPISLGKVLRQVDISPTNSTVDAYADGQTIDSATNTAAYELTFETAALPLEYQAYLLGHSFSNGEMIVTKDDVAPYFGIKFQSDKRNGTARYMTFYKVQFQEPSLTNRTKEADIEFQMPTITAKAIYRLSDGKPYKASDAEEGFDPTGFYDSMDETSGGEG